MYVRAVQDYATQKGFNIKSKLISEGKVYEVMKKTSVLHPAKYYVFTDVPNIEPIAVPKRIFTNIEHEHLSLYHVRDSSVDGQIKIILQSITKSILPVIKESLAANHRFASVSIAEDVAAKLIFSRLYGDKSLSDSVIETYKLYLNDSSYSASYLSPYILNIFEKILENRKQ